MRTRVALAAGATVAALGRGTAAVPFGMMGLRVAGWPMTMTGGRAAYRPGIPASYCGARGGVLARRQVGS